MLFRFLHLLHRVLEILGSIGQKVGNLLPEVVIEVYKVEVHVVDKKRKKELGRIFDAPDNKRSDKRRSTVLAN
ncbi:hypothetical protein TNCV_2322841 [Trichonephila clavipes]|nr:hypothetical protein TNCV_2322841 [Trichonephila clavipes]